MAHAIEAPAGVTAEGQTSHTQNRFSPYQLRMLHGGINGNRVRNLRGMSHLEAWDVRRQLIRVFGFGGFSIDTVSLDLVSERESKTGERSRWTIVYRAQVRLTLFTPDGRKLTHFEDAAAGDAVNQPSLGDAHDLAMKTAVSQALKRCAVNLGDQFGLSLYNNGSPEPVVVFSAAHPPEEWKRVEPPQPEPEDPPVQPEPGMAQDGDGGEQVSEVQAQEQSVETPMEALRRKVNNGWRDATALEQCLEEARAHGLLLEQVGDGMTVEALLTNRINELHDASMGRAA
ncbi:Rad52/Rad22 family DNA repair protein [Streptomyces chilikensis]|uniref:Rad52/Rad22 family DNA repair protein n=1 Tax=Streptomyces chilikensis TaxID=1194079 RepID=A0ABV3ERN3_9ACTN